MIPVIHEVDSTLPWLFRMRSVDVPLVDYVHAGAAFGDITSGVRGFDWTAESNPAGDVTVKRDDLDEVHAVASFPGITRLSVAFDQNMRVVIAYDDAAGAHLWYYSAQTGGMRTLSIPGGTGASVKMDDIREESTGDNDLLFCYTLNGELCMRVQREQYNVVHSTTIPGNLHLFGQTTQLCLQWRLI